MRFRICLVWVVILSSGAVSRSQAPDSSFSGAMAECEDTSGCTTWSFQENHAQGRWSNGGIADLIIEKFGASVSIRRVDTAGTGAGIKALYVGTRNGDRIDGTLSWTWPGHQSGTTNWHAPIQHAGPVPSTVITVGPLTTFMYPGTNYKTQLVAINDSGVAVGWFTPPVQGAVCDPVAFGGPCLSSDPAVFGVNIPYAFSYSNGKFQRLREPLAGVPNNLPISINNQGQVLIFHGRFTTVPGGNEYLLYDLATGATRKVSSGTAPGAGGPQSFLTGAMVHISSFNSNGAVAGAGEVVESAPGSGTKHEYGMFVGTADVRSEGNDAPSKASFKLVKIALKSCPAKESNVQFTEMQIAGPNDAGQIAVSCQKDAVVYDSISGRSTLFNAVDPDESVTVKGINDTGSVVGCVAGRKPFLHSGGKTSLLPIPGENGCALGINIEGQIVGFTGDKAFIYTSR